MTEVISRKNMKNPNKILGFFIIIFIKCTIDILGLEGQLF